MSEFAYSTKRASFKGEPHLKSRQSGAPRALTNVTLFDLQRTVGNRAVRTLMHRRPTRSSSALVVGPRDDQPPQRAAALVSQGVMPSDPTRHQGSSAGAVQGRIIQRTPATGGSVPATVAPSLAPMAYTAMSAEQLRTQHRLMQLMLMTTTFPPLSSSAPALRREVAKIEQALIDKVVAEQIKSTLDAFQSIEVFIPGTSTPLDPGKTGPPSPRTVTFHAAYFINTQTSKAHVKGARAASVFATIQKAADASSAASLIESSGKQYSSGRAAAVGKATPENVQAVVQEALDNGAVERYAVQQGKLAKTKKLNSLSSTDAANVVQDWVIDNGVGVDCSGFVLQAAVHGRDAVRAELGGLGVAEAALPKELGHGERKAKSFSGGPKVTKPTDLRSGDAWVLHNGRHVKIVIEVRRATNAKGKPIIEFDTAESAGDSTHTKTGPTLKANRTASLTNFGVKGSFHRMQ